MESAKKMVMVPPELLSRLEQRPPITSDGGGSGGLDDEMHNILNNKTLDDNTKWKLYQQVLQRHCTLLRKNVNQYHCR